MRKNAMSRIDFIAPLMLIDDEEDCEVTDWETLSKFVGRSFENSDTLGFFGQSIEEVPVAVLLDRSGNIQILANEDNDGLMAKATVRSVRELSSDELDILQNHVSGQWSDGVGECLELDDKFYFAIENNHVVRQQVNDGISTQGSGTRDLFPAIHAKDIDRVRAAIEAGENVHSVLAGTTTLGWAISCADAPIAHLLIDSGVDVHYREHGMNTVLVSCAASRDFADEGAASVAGRLLELGGFDQEEIETAAGIAESRGKIRLLTALKEQLGV